MQLEHICNECGREISSSEYEAQSDTFCSECGGPVEENTDKIWCVLDSNAQMTGPFYAKDLQRALTEKKIDEQTEIINLLNLEKKSLSLWEPLMAVLKPAAAVIDEVEGKSLLVTCEECKHEFSRRAQKCPKCGWVPTVICGICKSQIPLDSSACPECGDPTPFPVLDDSLNVPLASVQQSKFRSAETSTQNQNAPVLGIVSAGLGVGAVLMPYFAAVFLAPAAIICGILAFKKNQKSLGFVGTLLGIAGIASVIYTSNQLAKITSQIGGHFGEISSPQAIGSPSGASSGFNSQPNAIMPESLAGPQNNAVRSAKQYLSMQGFSRSGLIHQLSSDYGSGYNVADATAAVDSLDIDWNNQAVRSAKQYLSMQGFSCKGLIEQLSSSAGDKYTVSQATYGAGQAGACQ